jgi:hypothetical protein
MSEDENNLIHYRLDYEGEKSDAGAQLADMDRLVWELAMTEEFLYRATEE